MIESGSLLDGLPDGLYLLQAGRLRALIGDGEDRRVLRDIGRGEIVGEAALLTDQPRSATVVALRDSELFYLSIQSFEEVVAENPSFLRAVSAQVVSRMAVGGSSRSTEMPDVLVRPDVERFTMLDFGRFAELVEQGHREALDTLGGWWGARAA